MPPLWKARFFCIWVCGAESVSPATPVSEQRGLDLDREGLKSLCGEKKAQERIQYTLTTGKTLRN